MLSLFILLLRFYLQPTFHALLFTINILCHLTALFWGQSLHPVTDVCPVGYSFLLYLYVCLTALS